MTAICFELFLTYSCIYRQGLSNDFPYGKVVTPKNPMDNVQLNPDLRTLGPFFCFSWPIGVSGGVWPSCLGPNSLRAAHMMASRDRLQGSCEGGEITRVTWVCVTHLRGILGLWYISKFKNSHVIVIWYQVCLWTYGCVWRYKCEHIDIHLYTSIYF